MEAQTGVKQHVQRIRTGWDHRLERSEGASASIEIARLKPNAIGFPHDDDRFDWVHAICASKATLTTNYEEAGVASHFASVEAIPELGLTRVDANRALS